MPITKHTNSYKKTLISESGVDNQAVLQNVRYGVALSGGVDSVVLLHWLRQCFIVQKLSLDNLTAVHINHGISQFADDWQKLCQKYCDSLGLKLTSFKLKVDKNPGQGLENSARRARYKAFATLSDVDILVLAHHQDDQYETMLSQILRGSDIHNIAAMNDYRQYCNMKLWRPLLNVKKSDIKNYATTYSLKFVEDESNFDTSYLRNFLRQDIIPQLLSYDPQLYSKLESCLQSIKMTVEIVDEQAQSDLTACLSSEHLPKVLIMWDSLKKLSLARQFNVMTYFLRQQCSIIASHKQIHEFLRQCDESIKNGNGATPMMRCSHYEVICRKSRIFVSSDRLK